MAVATYTKAGSKASTPAKLDTKVFGLEVTNHELLKQSYQMYLANGRENLAKTLRRGEVRGGGKKPWKQKGTGRARFGSSRVPIWRGGGITFGPLGVENYTKDLPLKAKRTAIRQALSVKAAKNAVIIIEDFQPKELKTAQAAQLLEKIGAKGRILIAVENKTPELNRSIRNLASVNMVQSTYLNTYDILNADSIVITEKALAAITQWLGSAKEVK